MERGWRGDGDGGRGEGREVEENSYYLANTYCSFGEGSQRVGSHSCMFIFFFLSRLVTNQNL